MVRRRQHPCGGHVPSRSAIATMSAPASAQSLEGCPGEDANCGLHQWHREMVNHVLGPFFMDGRYDFLLWRLSHVGVPNFEFDGMSSVLPRSDSFNLGGPQSCISAIELCQAWVWRWSVMFSFGGCCGGARGRWWALVSSSEDYSVLSIFFTAWLMFLCAKAIVLLSFQFCQFGMCVACTMIFMICK